MVSAQVHEVHVNDKENNSSPNNSETSSTIAPSSPHEIQKHLFCSKKHQPDLNHTLATQIQGHTFTHIHIHTRIHTDLNTFIMDKRTQTRKQQLYDQFLLIIRISFFLRFVPSSQSNSIEIQMTTNSFFPPSSLPLEI